VHFIESAGSTVITEDQSEVIGFISSRLSPDEPARRVITHASLVLLTADRAFKLKRAVCFPFLDFSTAERRLHYCERELALNRRTAPELYLGVLRITRAMDGRLELDGFGELVDAIIEMRRFNEKDLFDNLAQRGELTSRVMTDLAKQIASFHRDADVDTSHGGIVGMSRVLEINEKGLRATSILAPDRTAALVDAFQAALERHSRLLDARCVAGKVRRCHGDLILRNICMFKGRPTLFDCLEFDEGLATIDVLYDLAFLLMDLWHRDQREHANLVFNRYLDQSDENDGLALVPFFMAVRAAVRAHVTAVQAGEADDERRSLLSTEAIDYFELAEALLARTSPTLVAVGGLSGSGKSTIAAAIAPALGSPPGARVLASDRIRKALHGVSPETRLPEEAYHPAVSERVYAQAREAVRMILSAGGSVVVDSVFDRQSDREAIEALAREAGVGFAGFWLTTPINILSDRIARREGDPSDATMSVLLAQAERDRGEMTWRVVDAGGDVSQVRDRILSSVGGTRHAIAGQAQAANRDKAAGESYDRVPVT
jgi:uncharacterized protein